MVMKHKGRAAVTPMTTSGSLTLLESWMKRSGICATLPSIIEDQPDIWEQAPAIVGQRGPQIGGRRINCDWSRSLLRHLGRSDRTIDGVIKITTIQE